MQLSCAECGDERPRGRHLKANVTLSSLTCTSVVSPSGPFSSAVTCNSDALELGFSDPVWLNALWGLSCVFLGDVSQSQTQRQARVSEHLTGHWRQFCLSERLCADGTEQRPADNPRLGRGEKPSTVLEEVRSCVGTRCWLTLALPGLEQGSWGQESPGRRFACGPGPLFKHLSVRRDSNTKLLSGTRAFIPAFFPPSRRRRDTPLG